MALCNRDWQLSKEERKRKLLKHYAEREPTVFYQLDGFADVQEDCVFTRDKEGDCCFSGITQELMHGANVRILIREGTPKEDAIRLILKWANYLRRDDVKALCRETYFDSDDGLMWQQIAEILG